MTLKKIEEDKDDVSSAVIKEMISKWIDLQNVVEKHRPDTVITNRTVNIFNNNVITHFGNILTHGQKQHSMDKFLLKRRTTPKKISPEPKRQRIVVYEDNERDFQGVIMEGTPLLSSNLLHYQLCHMY